MTSRRTIWLRRTAAMAVVAIVVAVPVTLLARGSEDSGPESGARAEPELAPASVDQGLRVGYRVPRGWRSRKQDRTLRLATRDRSILIAVAAPAPAGRANRVRRDLLAGIRESYRKVEVSRGEDREIGGLDAQTAVGTARQERGGGELRILVAVAEGEERTYVVEVFTAAAAKPNRIRQAQAALNALELRG